MSENDTKFESWVILELMGHRRLAGFLTEQQIGGASFIRIDVPKAEGEGWIATQMYAPASVYCITPTTEEIARKVAARSQPEPVSRWELQPDRVLPAAVSHDDIDDEERCENCGAPATHQTADDVDLCERCYAQTPVQP